MKQITLDIPDDMDTRITRAVLRGHAESDVDLITKALRFYFGGAFYAG